MSNKTDTSNKVRIDKWLWAARFFKTRQLAVKALKTGKISLNKHSCKPASSIKIGDILKIKRGFQEMEVEVMELSENRGPASVAQQLYAETEHSQVHRREMREKMAAQPRIEFDVRKPDRRDVRSHRALKRGQ